MLLAFVMGSFCDFVFDLYLSAEVKKVDTSKTAKSEAGRDGRR
jgi:hypothetical protein